MKTPLPTWDAASQASSSPRAKPPLTQEGRSSSIVIGALIKGREGRAASLRTRHGTSLACPFLRWEGTEVGAVEGKNTGDPDLPAARAPGGRSVGSKIGTSPALVTK